MLLWSTCLLGLLAVSQGASKESRRQCIRSSLIERHRLSPQLFASCDGARFRRRVDATFHGKPKPRAELLANKFLPSYSLEQTNSLVELVTKIAKEYLVKCPPTIYYDSTVTRTNGHLLDKLFKTMPVTFYHGSIKDNFEPRNPNFMNHIDTNCKSYILFLSEPVMARKILGPQTDSRVVVISSSSQWKLRDFLSSESSSNIVNLLVIGESLMSSQERVSMRMLKR
ncbi:PREDICTED: ionotropic receptor 21a-like [Drosophila arizonae]|uniref:Ionotropic receptor 21a-like n=1 Tax=Drosophila arizonae TaxID=7263 RepID=A0ABM1Q0B3_DROAR|nr:PREDICTED: ionotropic receptor 21a-like [Drosophila arizonae]